MKIKDNLEIEINNSDIDRRSIIYEEDNNNNPQNTIRTFKSLKKSNSKCYWKTNISIGSCIVRSPIGSNRCCINTYFEFIIP